MLCVLCSQVSPPSKKLEKEWKDDYNKTWCMHGKHCAAGEWQAKLCTSGSGGWSL